MVNETNPLSNSQRKRFEASPYNQIQWEEVKRRIKSPAHKVLAERIRYVSDPGYPEWDMTYFIVNIDGIPYHVQQFPLSRVPKPFTRNFWRMFKREGVYLPNLAKCISTME